MEWSSPTKTRCWVLPRVIYWEWARTATAGREFSFLVVGKKKGRYNRITVLVFDPDGHILLVKHKGQKSWSLPGGHWEAPESPARRAVIEVAEETGLHIATVRRGGYYKGGVAIHQIFIAHATGRPKPDRREVEDAVWWDGRGLPVQSHVNAVIAVARMAAEEEEPFPTG